MVCRILYNKTDADYDGIPTIFSYRIDKVLKTGLANKCMHEAIVNYSYQPANGYIKPTKKVVILMYNKNDGFSDDVSYKLVLYKHQIPHLINLTADTRNKGTVRASSALSNTPFTYINRTSYNYYQSVEGYTFVHVHSGENSSFRNQPQVHLGLLATPALNPATESDNLLISSVYILYRIHLAMWNLTWSQCVLAVIRTTGQKMLNYLLTKKKDIKDMEL